MNRLFLPVCLVAFAFIQGCSDGKIKKETLADNVEEINVNLNEATEKNAADYFKFDSYIILETTDRCLISTIDKVVLHNDKIFILNLDKGSVFIFSKEGKFLNEISKRGQGPDEYIALDDLSIDKDNNSLLLYDGQTGYLLSYDFSGNFIAKRAVEKGYSLANLQDNNWIFYKGNGFGDQIKYPNNLILCDNQFNKKNEFLPINQNMLGIRYEVVTTKSVFSEYDDTTYILPLLSNEVYAYDKKSGSVVTKYRINFSSNNEYIDGHSTKTEVDAFFSKLSKGEVSSKVHSFYKVDNHVFFGFFYQKRYCSCIYNTFTKEAKLCSFFYDENGLFFKPAVFSSDKQGQKVMSILDGADFEMCKEKDKKGNPIIKNINDSIKGIDDPNPILLFYKFIK